VKRTERRFLKDPDEFVVWTSRLGTWAQHHRTTLMAAGSILLATVVGAGFLGWRSARQLEAASDAFRVARGKFARNDYGSAALDFETLARDYPGTSFGRLAVLYRGHCLLRTGDAPGAVTAYQEFLAGSGNDPYLRQLALTDLAQAQERSGAIADARDTAAQASEITGPYRVEALLVYARLAEAAGDAAAAEGAYRKILAEKPDPETRTFVERQIPPGEEPPAG
jgi:tetratricopeptide (TPR) repeat protein